MSEEKFTPAPWRSCDEELVGADNNTVAVFVCCGNVETNAANAHLIAQAPAMYAELNGEWLNRLLGMVEDSGDPYMREAAAMFIRRRDDLLAAARGEGDE